MTRADGLVSSYSFLLHLAPASQSPLINEFALANNTLHLPIGRVAKLGKEGATLTQGPEEVYFPCKHCAKVHLSLLSGMPSPPLVVTAASGRLPQLQARPSFLLEPVLIVLCLLVAPKTSASSHSPAWRRFRLTPSSSWCSSLRSQGATRYSSAPCLSPQPLHSRTMLHVAPDEFHTPMGSGVSLLPFR
ncbi:hypothetical protein LZ30DRAFT_409946 [Colletotrichum cereale]|nr:hypothetical protein LZ30DRAFT_409946 [Colletotrichum cereale]